MEQEEAKRVGAHLARSVEATSETEWAFWAALWAFPSSPNAEPWLPKGEAVAHWLDGQGLMSVTATGPANLDIIARPVALGAWRINVSYESAQINVGGFGRPGLVSNWVISPPVGDKLEISGQIVVTRESLDPDDAENLASQITRKALALGEA